MKLDFLHLICNKGHSDSKFSKHGPECELFLSEMSIILVILGVECFSKN